MRGSVKKAVGWISRLPHPSSGTLIAFCDGELEETTETDIRTHLERCAYCRERSEQLLNGLRFVTDASKLSAPSFSVDAGLARLSTAVANRQSADNVVRPPSAAAVSSITYDRLLSELTIYLGPAAATRLLDRCNHSLLHRERLSVVVGPVVRTFLGEHAGEAVLDNVLRIWDVSQNVNREGLAL